MVLICKLRLSIREQDVIDYLNACYPYHSFIAQYSNGFGSEHHIYCKQSITEIEANEMVQKLHLTSIHFVDRFNYVHN